MYGAAYSMGPSGAGGDLNARKQALIQKLSGQNKGAGGAARLSGGVPFGALPRLGFNPNARSVFGRQEQFNFSGGPPGFDQATGTPGQGPTQAPQQLTELGGVGPAAGEGSGSPGTPQGADGAPQQYQAQGGGSSYDPQGDSSPWHLLDGGGQAQQPAPAFGGLGPSPGSLEDWIQQNPWFVQQFTGGGGVL